MKVVVRNFDSCQCVLRYTTWQTQKEQFLVVAAACQMRMHKRPRGKELKMELDIAVSCAEQA